MEFLRDSSMSRAQSFASCNSGHDETASTPSSPVPVHQSAYHAQVQAPLQLANTSNLALPGFAPHQSSSTGAPSSPLPGASFYRMQTSQQGPANPSFFVHSPNMMPASLPTPPSDEPIAPGLLLRSSTQDNALTRPWDEDANTQQSEIPMSTSSSAQHNDDMGAYSVDNALSSIPRRHSSQRSTTSQDSFGTSTLRETYGQRQQGAAQRQYPFGSLGFSSMLGPRATNEPQPGLFVASLPRTSSGPRPTISPQELSSTVVTSDADQQRTLSVPRSSVLLNGTLARTSSSQISLESDDSPSSSGGSGSQLQLAESPSNRALQRRSSAVPTARSSSSQSFYPVHQRFASQPFYTGVDPRSIGASQSTSNDNHDHAASHQPVPHPASAATPSSPASSQRSYHTPNSNNSDRLPLRDVTDEHANETLHDSPPRGDAEPLSSQSRVSGERSTYSDGPADSSSSPLSSVTENESDEAEQVEAVNALLSLSQNNSDKRTGSKEADQIADERQIRIWRRENIKHADSNKEAPQASSSTAALKKRKGFANDEDAEVQDDPKLQKNNNGARTLRNVRFASAEASGSAPRATGSPDMLPAALLYSTAGRITRGAAAKVNLPGPSTSAATAPSSDLSTLSSLSSSTASSTRTSPSQSPPRARPARNARPRAEIAIPAPAPAAAPAPLPAAAPAPAAVPAPAPAEPAEYQQRIFPADLPIRDEFPGWYRRHRVPSTLPADIATQVYGGLTAATFHADIKDVAQRGMRSIGTRNDPEPPVMNLYTPRFVRGRGAAKEALCTICYEDGSSRWFKTKVSAYNYHLQNAHGISSVTGEPLDPPIEFSVVARPHHLAGEKSELLTGKCHACQRFVELEGPKLGTVKVPEIYWWKHAATCHRSKPCLEGTGGIYIEDAFYQRITAWVAAQPDDDDDDDAQGEEEDADGENQMAVEVVIDVAATQDS